MQTFKNKLVSILVRVDDNFQIHFWGWLLPQTVLTLNLLWQSNVAPKESA